MQQHWLPSSCALIALSITHAFAEDTTTLDSIVVTGRRVESRLEDTPQRIEVINKRDIEATPARELTDLLKKNSSVDVIQYPGNLSGIGIRGFRPEFSGINKRSLLLIDGRPAMSTNLSLINLDRAERVEVLKGPASALYGSSAMGGVVNIITRESRGKLNGFGQIAYGSFDTWDLRAGLGGAINQSLDFDYTGSLLDQSDDFRMGDGRVRPNTAYSQQNHGLRIGLNLAPDWRLNLNSEIYRGRDIATPGDLSTGTSGQSNKDMDRSGTDLKLTGKLGSHQFSARVFGGDQSYELYKKTSTVAAEQRYLPFRSFDEELRYSGWQVQDFWAWSEQASLIFGVDQETIEQETRSYNANGTRKAPSSANNRRDALGFFAENTWTLNGGDTTFYAGVRHDRIETETFATPLMRTFVPGKADFTTVNPSAGFKHLVGANVRVHGTVGKGFVPPSSTELTGSAVTVKTGKDDVLSGNPGLEPESSVTWDLGAEWSSGAWFADLTVFTTKVKDKITRLQVGEDANNRYFSYANANTAHMQGLEWEGRWRASPALTLSIAGTHYFHRYEDVAGERSDVRNVPRNTVRASADVDYGPWNGRFGVRHVGQWKDNDWNGNSADIITYAPFTTADLSVRYRFDPHQSVAASVENLFDRYYAEKGGYPLPGRNFKLAYRYQF